MKKIRNIESFINSYKNIDRINELIAEIKTLNNLDDYSRLKRYNLIIYNIRLLKDYLKNNS